MLDKKEERIIFKPLLFVDKLTCNCEIKLEPFFNLITDIKKWESIAFPWWCKGKEPAYTNTGDVQIWFDPWVMGISLEEKQQPPPGFCLETLWTEEPERLQSQGLQRVGHNKAVCAHTHTDF